MYSVRIIMNGEWMWWWYEAQLQDMPGKTEEKSLETPVRIAGLLVKI
jgi:hypothetical protein